MTSLMGWSEGLTDWTFGDGYEWREGVYEDPIKEDEGKEVFPISLLTVALQSQLLSLFQQRAPSTLVLHRTITNHDPSRLDAGPQSHLASMRSFISSLALAALSLSSLSTLAAPASSSPSITLRSYGSTDASTSSPFKRLLTANICARINLVLEHEIYVCTLETDGVVASNFYPGNIATPFANVQHGIQAAGGDPTYIDEKMNPPINPLAPPIGAGGKDFIGGQQGGDNFPGGDGATFTGPDASESITGLGKPRPQAGKRETTYAAIPEGQTCVLQTTEELTLKVDVCICISAGVLTDASKQAIIDAVNDPANAQIIELLTTELNGHTDFPDKQAIIDYLEQYALDTVGSQSTDCRYPMGAIPDSCDDCHSTCPEGTYKCGDACIPEDQDCRSDMPVISKRDFLSGPDIRCPAEMTACGIPSTDFFTGRNFECIDTSANIESCGACAFPLPGQPIGIDCTAIPHTTAVACHGGRCIVEDCERGFELNTEASACLATHTQSFFGSRRRTREALRTRQVSADSLRHKSTA